MTIDGQTIKRCVVIGGGSHALTLLDILLQDRHVEVYGILDADKKRGGEHVFGVPVLGGDDWLPEAANHGVTHFVNGVGSVGDTRLRERLYLLALEHSLKPYSVVHPNAVISPGAKLGLGNQIMANAVVNRNARLGDNVIINTGSIVEHDCLIGDHVHVASGACLTGHVQVGHGTHIGAGATIRQSVVIGEYAIIGLSAGVIRDVPSHATVVGVPARPIS